MKQFAIFNGRPIFTALGNITVTFSTHS